MVLPPRPGRAACRWRTPSPRPGTGLPSIIATAATASGTRSGVPPKIRVGPKPESWSSTAAKAISPARSSAEGVRLMGPPRRLSPPATLAREHLHELEPAEVGERLDVHALVELNLVEVRPRHPADRYPAREDGLALALGGEPRSHDRGALGRAPALLDVVQEQVSGSPTVGLTTPLAPGVPPGRPPRWTRR